MIMAKSTMNLDSDVLAAFRHFCRDHDIANVTNRMRQVLRDWIVARGYDPDKYITNGNTTKEEDCDVEPEEEDEEEHQQLPPRNPRPAASRPDTCIEEEDVEAVEALYDALEEKGIVVASSPGPAMELYKVWPCYVEWVQDTDEADLPLKWGCLFDCKDLNKGKEYQKMVAPKNVPLLKAVRTLQKDRGFGKGQMSSRG